MKFDHRKALLITKHDKLDDCIDDCSKKDEGCKKLCEIYPPPLKHHEAHTTVRKSFLITGCLVTAVFVFCLVFMIVKRFLSGRNGSDERSTGRNLLPIMFDTQESFADEDRGPNVDHHIWYINTVGLPRSVIDAIGVIEYKKADGLIESTECSVCLSEFEDGESVRLLPKCSHAFHVSCIDTWLWSHKNCPLCRAPIVRRDTSSGAVSFPSVSEQISGELGSEEENPAGNVVPIDEGGSSRGTRVEDSDSESVIRRCGKSRVLSDLCGKRGISGETIQPVRRSVSLDAASAVAMRSAVAIRVSDIGSSDSYPLGSKSGKGSNISVFSKRVGENLSIYRLMRSSSIGISLQKGPVPMKRSSSLSRRALSFSKHRRTQSSIIPA